MKCKLTFWPDDEVDIPDIEYVDLQRQGLVVAEKQSPPKTPPADSSTGDGKTGK